VSNAAALPAWRTSEPGPCSRDVSREAARSRSPSTSRDDALAARLPAVLAGLAPVCLRAGQPRVWALPAVALSLCIVVATAGWANDTTAAQNPPTGVTAAPTTFQVNPPLGPPASPYTDNFPANFQMEPSIARDPTSGRFVAGAMDYIDEAPCQSTGSGTLQGTQYVSGTCVSASFRYTGIDGVYQSMDGRRWTQVVNHDGATSGAGGPCTATTHTLPGYCRAGLASGYDVQVAFGPRPRASGAGFSWSAGARAYYSNLPRRLTTDYPGPAVAVSTSDDDGTTWAMPVVLRGTASTAIVNDKDGLWVDRDAASPCFGDAYLAWDVSTDGGRTWQVAFSRSADGGVTWSRWIDLLPQTTSLEPGPVVRSLPDGTVMVGWEAGVNGVPAMQVAGVGACGRTPSHPVTVAPFVSPPGRLAGSSFPLTDFPAMAADSAGRLYLAWIDFNAHDITHLRFSKSSDRGATWSQPATLGNTLHSAVFPSIAVTPDGSQVVIAYLSLFVHSKTPGTGSVDTWCVYVRSRDGGGSWAVHALMSSTVDVDGSSTLQLNSQRLGDYTSIVITGNRGKHTAYPIWTDPRHAAPCALVDAYRQALTAGQAPARPDPDLDGQCPQGFGDTDIFAASIALD
jgi:hypothetical protein